MLPNAVDEIGEGQCHNIREDIYGKEIRKFVGEVEGSGTWQPQSKDNISSMSLASKVKHAKICVTTLQATIPISEG